MKTYTATEIGEIIEEHKKWLNSEGGERANLRDADLCGADLRDANLRGANLRGAYLCDAILRGADLRGADLCGANLCGAYLCDANLRGADLRGADLCGANLRGADLRGANLCGTCGDLNYLKSIFLETYQITYTAEVMQIGCQKYDISEWWDFDDRKILEMDGKTALKFWRKYKEFIKMAIELSPATPTK